MMIVLTPGFLGRYAAIKRRIVIVQSAQTAHLLAARLERPARISNVWLVRQIQSAQGQRNIVISSLTRILV